MSSFVIVSGGQTGADRAALDFAIENGISHGGWCPRGRLAEDGPLDSCYQLKETSSSNYAERTECNVRDSDATLVFSLASDTTGGTRLTLELARKHNKPCLHLARDANRPVVAHAAAMQGFLDVHRIKRLNIAGPRTSQAPGIEAFVREVLAATFAKNIVFSHA